MPIQIRHIAEPDPFSYHVCIPDGIESKTGLPIIVFLHGFGERGDDPSLILQSGLGSLFESLQLPALIIFPQCDTAHRAFYGAMEERVLRAIADSQNVYGADPNLIYLCGYSMGASSCLLLAARHPQMFSGVITVAVGVTWPESYEPPEFPNDESQQQQFESMFTSEQRARSIAELIKGTPIWFLHGALDSACPISEARWLEAELKNVGASPRFTEFSSYGHDVLIRALQTERLFDWLLAQRR
jgi:predicted peptidase